MYMNLLFAAGYLQGIFKATRIQNESKSLIDHIHFNNIQAKISSGVIISDISDHFFYIYMRTVEHAQTSPYWKYLWLFLVCLHKCLQNQLSFKTETIQ